MLFTARVRRYLRCMTDRNDRTTHFGFRDISVEEKAPMVQGVFESVASRYDIMNDLMSLGAHRFWKDALMDWMRPRAGEYCLDVAGGTGDIAERIRKRQGGQDAAGRVLVFDLTEGMLRAGRERFQGRDDLQWVCGNAETLPFEDNSFDAYTISFGLRNVSRPDLALAEARRVLRPGGRFFCLEFSQVVLPILKDIYDQYSFKLLPTLGGLVAGDRESYQYLVESIRRFPSQEKLEDMMREAGFGRVTHRNMSGGIVAVHNGWRM